MAPDQSVEPPTVLPVIVNGVLIEFEVDSGSALTLIGEEVFHRLWKGSLPRLKTSSLKIRTWSQERITFCTTAPTTLFGFPWPAFFVARALYLLQFSMFSKDDKDRAGKSYVSRWGVQSRAT
ncbi:hypothetical protein M513_11903 [Trichuris suis]|uniref:Uncharacterized protein n=1 Tax=Trichuris suis TaxID=68888 RepID=A0A085LQF0_9BILA|nr:hypothetical protein M513_11903 [Trichuris suis]